VEIFGGSGYGASHSVGALLGELLSGDSEGYERRAQGKDIAPWGSINQEL